MIQHIYTLGHCAWDGWLRCVWGMCAIWWPCMQVLSKCLISLFLQAVEVNWVSFYFPGVSRMLCPNCHLWFFKFAFWAPAVGLLVVFAVCVTPFSGSGVPTSNNYQNHPLGLPRQLLSKPVRLCQSLFILARRVVIGVCSSQVNCMNS